MADKEALFIEFQDINGNYNVWRRGQILGVATVEEQTFSLPEPTTVPAHGYVQLMTAPQRAVKVSVQEAQRLQGMLWSRA